MNIIKLKSKMVEQGMTQKKLAANIGISVQAINAKLNNRSCLTIEETRKIICILNIDNPSEIFFDSYALNMQQDIKNYQ